jgi:hypothetical protein
MAKPVVDFHCRGGTCEGRLVVTRGNALGSLIATIGRLPAATPPGSEPGLVVVQSSSGKGCTEGEEVHWRREFPGSTIKSRWYWHQEEQLAVDSFEYLGIKDFAAFGFDLVPFEHEVCEGGKTSTVTGFAHITRAQWILGFKLPAMLSLKADGTSTPFVDGTGWKVHVKVEHPVVGMVVAYDGDVTVTQPSDLRDECSRNGAPPQTSGPARAP